jgi:hypothetical protein
MKGSNNPESDRSATPRPHGAAGDSSDGQDGTLRAAILAVAAAAAVLSAGALAFAGTRTAIGVAIGGALAIANLVVLARIGQAFISRKGRTAPWAVIAAVKLVVLFGGVWLLLRSGVASGLALALGYCALPAGITLGSLFGPKPPESDPGENPPNEGPAAPSADRGDHTTPSNVSDADVLEAGRRDRQGSVNESH